jgi:anti-sigma regulatory factor (Ser/Thr protein kinase)
MRKLSQRSQAIRDFILENVIDHSQDIVAVTARKFGISRQAALRHTHVLKESGLISFEGKTRNRKYSLRYFVEIEKAYPLINLEEDQIWKEFMQPQLADVPDNVANICEYGFTEMLNNAIDHSEGNGVYVKLSRTAINIEMYVVDNGIGIFNKIQKELKLDDPMYSILELAKGKLTTDPKRHTGEGIFFTSRVFDSYSIWSGCLYFAHLENRDWLLEDKKDEKKGTLIKMVIASKSDQTLKKTFDYYASGDDYGFSKTLIPVFLAEYGNENLISRSQAKRLLMRFERFKEIVLDFNKVNSIGQAFADEIFRVFQSEHPSIRLIAVNANEEVTKMIQRVREPLENST